MSSSAIHALQGFEPSAIPSAIHTGVVETRVVLVGPDRSDRTHFDVHRGSPLGS
jgi:hypothetical protein